MIERTETNWVQTFTGRQFWPQNPRVEDICIEDIAHGLSMKCRFTGQTKKFYSVAQHSYYVSNCLWDSHANNPHRLVLSLWGLLHDAAEAYLADIPRPLKDDFKIGDETFRQVEDRLLEMIIRKYGLDWPEPLEVKVADNILLATEKRDFMPKRDRKITVEPLNYELYSWTPESAEMYFLEKFRVLYSSTK